MADVLIDDVFRMVQANRPAAPGYFQRATRFAGRNKRKMVVYTTAAVAGTLAIVATGGVAAVAIGGYVALKGGTATLKRTYRYAKEKYFARTINRTLAEVRKEIGESLSSERSAAGDLVARKNAAAILSKISHQVKHGKLLDAVHAFSGFMQAKTKVDLAWAEVEKGGGFHSCAEAIHVVEQMGKMARTYVQMADDFELIEELVTFIMLERSRMDYELDTHFGTFMMYLSGVAEIAPDSGRGDAIADHPLMKLLNDAANERAVMRHWNERGGRDYSAWIQHVLSVSGKGFTIRGSTPVSPYGFGSQDGRAGEGVTGVGLSGASGGGKVLANSVNLMGIGFEAAAIAPLAGVGAGEAILMAGVDKTNDWWNRRQLRTGRTLGWRGLRELSDSERALLLRGEAKKHIEKLVEKFLHLLKAHDEWLKDAEAVKSSFVGGRGSGASYGAYLASATRLLRRQKLFWQVFDDEGGLMIPMAEFSEFVAQKAILINHAYLEENNDTHSMHSNVEGELRTWLAEHHDHLCPDRQPCYMSTAQLNLFDPEQFPPPRSPADIRPIRSIWDTLLMQLDELLGR